MYLVKSDLSSVGYLYTRTLDKSHGYRNTRPCITGHPVAPVKIVILSEIGQIQLFMSCRHLKMSMLKLDRSACMIQLARNDDHELNGVFNWNLTTGVDVK